MCGQLARRLSGISIVAGVQRPTSFLVGTSSSTGRSLHAQTRITVARASVVRLESRRIWSGSSRAGHSLTI